MRLGIKNEQVHFVLRSTFITLPQCGEDKMRLGIKNEQVHFVLRSTFIIFAKIIKTCAFRGRFTHFVQFN